MTVQDAVRTVTVPRPAEPADPPLPPPPAAAAAPAAPAPAVAPLVGRARPLTADERGFLVALVVMLVGLMSVILTGLLMAQYVWA